MPSVARELEHERARDAEQAARRSRAAWRTHAVAHDEHVGAGGLAQLVAGVGEDGLAGAALVGERERAHVLGVRRGLEPGGRAAVVAHPRHDDHPDRRRPRRARRCWRRSTVGPASPRSEPRGATPPVTVMRSRASACVVRREHRVGRGAQLAAVGHGEPEPGGGVREPVEVTGPRERLAAVDADRLEHAVAHEQAVVERRDPRRASASTSAPLTQTARRCARHAHGCPLTTRPGSRRRRPRPAADGRLELGLAPTRRRDRSRRRCRRPRRAGCSRRRRCRAR